jgi:O-antigen/teichoic acid export membrane protein
MSDLSPGPAARVPGLRRLALAGVTWLGMSQVGMYLIALASSLLLARLLTPAEFGLAAMAMLAVGILSTVSNLGLPTAIVQRESLTEAHRSSAFWILLGWGGALWTLVIFLAPAMGAFFRAPGVVGLMALCGGTLFLAAASAVPNGLLARGMDFRRLAWIELAGTVAAAITSIGLAIAGWRSWSLIWGPVAGGVVTTASVWGCSGWRPRAWVDRKAVREVLGYGLDLSGFSILNYLRSNVDYVLVGRLLGAEALGVYTKAYEMVVFPQMKLVPVLTRALFPAFARMQDDPARLRQAYVRVNGYVAVFCFPLLAGLALTAPELVPFLWGGQWAGVILPTRILCVAGLLYANATTVGTILFTQGHTRLALRLALWGLAGITGCVIVGSRFGVAGVAWAVVTYAVIAVPIVQHLTNRVIALPMRDLLGALIPAAVAAGAMTVGVLTARWWTADLDVWARLSVSVGIGAAIYLGTLRWRFPGLVAEIRGLLREAAHPSTGGGA